jgi:hypothetical protein
MHDYEGEEYLITDDLLKSLLSAKSTEGRGIDPRGDVPSKINGGPKI